MVVAMMGVNDLGSHMPYETTTGPGAIRFIKLLKVYKLARLVWMHAVIKAKETYKKTIGWNPRDYNAYVGLGNFYYAQGNYALAEESFKKALDMNPINDDAYAELGRIYREQGRFQEAEDSFKKALDINPGNDNASVKLARIYREKRQFLEAGELLTRVLDLNSEDNDAHVELGILYQAQRHTESNFAREEEALKKAIGVNPESERAYFRLGMLYRMQHRFGEAEDSFKQCIVIDPNNDRACGALSALYEETGRPDLAEEYARKADKSRYEYYIPVTIANYRRLKEILDARGVKLVCVQYPMRGVGQLKRIFEGEYGVVFVDNEASFRYMVNKSSFKEIFADSFGGDFGHCTEKGYRLLAENIAGVIAREVLGR